MHEYVGVFLVHFYFESGNHAVEKFALHQQAPSEWHARKAMIERLRAVECDTEFGFVLVSMAKLNVERRMI